MDWDEARAAIMSRSLDAEEGLDSLRDALSGEDIGTARDMIVMALDTATGMLEMLEEWETSSGGGD